MDPLTLTDLQNRTLTRLRESTSAPVFFTAAEIVAALNTAQRLFVLLTLCLETTDDMTINGAAQAYRPLTLFADWLLPLDVRIQGNGGKLKPGRLEEFEAEDTTWEGKVDPPAAYAMLGFDYMVFDRLPAAATTLDVVYARCPTAMVSGSDVPEIPTEHHELLSDAGIVFARLKEGAQEFQKELPRLDAFFAGVQQVAAHVRARNVELGYDSTPPEIGRIDLSKLVKKGRM